MLRRRLHNTLAAFSCLLLLLGIGPDLILCFGHDGHVALEIPSPEKGCATAPCSGSPHGSSLAGNPATPAAGPPCGVSCLDIALTLSTPAAFARPEGECLPHEGPSAIRPHDARHCPSGQEALCPAHRATLPCSGKSVTESLRSTILRI